jgi:peptidoglycan/xylan/chitin deacetylase (PgdA/CDA1 family)
VPSPALAFSATAVPLADRSATDVTPPVTVASGADGNWHRTAVRVHLMATDAESLVAATYLKVDAGAWTQGDEIIVPAPKNHSNDGVHTVAFYSVDSASPPNTETPKTVTVKIDTTPPGFTWRGVSPAVVTSIRSVDFQFTVREATGPVRITGVMTDQYGYRASALAVVTRDPGARQVTMVPRHADHRAFTPGLYRLALTLKDAAGNVTVTSPKGFRDYRPAAAKVYFHLPAAGRRVALTFDDGGYNAAWASMLSTLKRYGAHATFFPLGPNVDPPMARRTLAYGDAIGSHGWTHTEMTRQSYPQVLHEWVSSEAPWWSAAGVTPVPYCRPPYGSHNGTTAAAAGAAGFTRVILWDVDPRDWSTPGVSVIVERVLSHLHSGAIVCMHIRPQTAQALPAILSGMHARGYKAVSIPELFRAAGYR